MIEIEEFAAKVAANTRDIRHDALADILDAVFDAADDPTDAAPKIAETLGQLVALTSRVTLLALPNGWRKP
jgi:hypothetical protein